MFFKKGKNRRAPLRKSVRGRRPLRKSSVSVGVKKYVKRQIHRNIENKCVQINGGNQFGNVLESPELNAYPMCPLATFWTISAGVGQGNRIGNQIKTRKVYLNYIIRPMPYDNTVNSIPRPMDVQLMLGYVKNTPSFSPVPGDVNQLFQAGSSVAAPVGNIRDIISIINTDYWVIKKRWTHKIGYANYGGTTSSAPIQSQNQFFANNDYKYSIIKRLDITAHIPKLHIFNDGSSSTNSKNLFFMYYAVAADGSTYTSNQLPASVEFWIDFHYEDA